MRDRLQRDSNALLPLDDLLQSLERRIRGRIFANHQESDRTQSLWRGLRRYADRSQVWRVTRSGHHRDDEAKDEDGDADDRERDPCDLEQDAGALSH